MPKITVVIPCYKRPQRTMRVCQDLLEQTLSGWEAFFIGDDCGDFQELIDNGFFEAKAKIARSKGNALIYSNLPNHYGGYGYEIRNRAKALANGDYICFVDNDDRILPHHLEVYYNHIKDTDLDFAYFNTYIYPIGKERNAKLQDGYIGHSELIIKTDFYKRMPPQQAEYGHDWKLVSDMMQAGAKYSKFETEPTYIVMGLGELRETQLD